MPRKKKSEIEQQNAFIDETIELSQSMPEENTKPKRRGRKSKAKIEEEEKILAETKESIDYKQSAESEKKVFVPSEDQKLFFDFIVHGTGNAVLKACAGSGKTTTLVNALKLIDPELKTLFLAFNKTIVDELKVKIGKMKNVSIGTVHSVGYNMVKRNISFDIETDKYKYTQYLKDNLEFLTEANMWTMKKWQRNMFKENVKNLIDLARCYLAQTPKEVEDIARNYGVELFADEPNVVIKALTWGKEHTKTVDFGDMVWLPYEMNMAPKGLQYDFIFIDECFPYDQKVFLGTDSGTMKIGEIYERLKDPKTKDLPLYVTTWDIERMKYVKRRITKAWKRPKKQIHVLSLDNGWDIKTTENEMFYTKDNGYVPLSALQSGDLIYYTYDFSTMLFTEKFEKWILNGGVKGDRDVANIISRLGFIDETAKYVYIDAKYVSNDAVETLISKLELLGFKGFKIYDNTNLILSNNDKEYDFLIKRIAPYLPLDYADACKDCPDFNTLYGYAEVKVIINEGEEDVTYDIEVEGTHNFFIIDDDDTNMVLVHNCQDISDVQRELFLRCFKKGTRFVACGDPAQAIYAFNGANAKSFEKLQNLPNTQTMPLSITYRCPKKVVDFVHKFVPDMVPRDNAPDGEIIDDVSIRSIENNAMVLCRTKAPLFKLYMRYLRMNRTAYIRGKDIGTNLANMISATDQFDLNTDLRKDGVFVRLYDRLFQTRNNIMIKRGLEAKEACMTDAVTDLYDSIQALEVLAEGLRTEKELEGRINTVFDDGKAGICLSTVHKAKGLEANEVYIACHSLMPSSRAERDWEIEQEKNLEYVAYTRTKMKLGFISEKELPPSRGMLDANKMVHDLTVIENQICKVLNKQPLVQMSGPELVREKMNKLTEVDMKPTGLTTNNKVLVIDHDSQIEDKEDNIKNLDTDDAEALEEILKLVKGKGGIKKLRDFLRS